MVDIIHDTTISDEILAQRRESGADRWDEVWEGTYVMSPLPNDEHQELVSKLTSVFEAIIGWPGLGLVRPGVNVSDRNEGWQENFRCPDVVIFLQQTQARNRGTHWVGGPDFAVEVLSPQDKAREKLDFYAAVGVRELLLIDRDPWGLELYRLRDQVLEPAGRSTIDDPQALESTVVPVTFHLAAGDSRPRIVVTHADGEPSWTL